jgi:hypothetical protein
MQGRFSSYRCTLMTMVFALAAVSCLSAHAQDDSRQKKIYELMEIIGLKRNFDQLKTPGALKDSAAKLFGPLPGGSSEEQSKAEERYLAPMLANIDTEKMMEAWVDAYGQTMTEADIDVVLAYYKSPAGQKDVVAQRMAGEALTVAMGIELRAGTKAVMDQLSKDINAITKDAPGAGGSTK